LHGRRDGGQRGFPRLLGTWRERVGRWIDRASPEDLLNVDIFFDLRPVHGDGALAARARRAFLHGVEERARGLVQRTASLGILVAC
jgi:signal-transduction protein with cAMP-binding, CBS, and nucleotidyltransferase domain